MNINFVQQSAYFVFEVNEEYYRVSFEREKKEENWVVRLVKVNRNQTVYSKQLDAVVVPDIQLAEDMVKTYVDRN